MDNGRESVHLREIQRPRVTEDMVVANRRCSFIVLLAGLGVATGTVVVRGGPPPDALPPARTAPAESAAAAPKKSAAPATDSTHAAGAGETASRPAELPPSPAPAVLPALPPSPAGSGAGANCPTAPPCLPADCPVKPGPCFWLTADYLLWWTRSSHLPPLLTTGSPLDALPGAGGQPNTRVVIGGSPDFPVQSGLRVGTGVWLTDDPSLGIDAGFFFLGRQSRQFTAGSAGSPLLARPFFNAFAAGAPDVQYLAFPGVTAGGLQATVHSRLTGYDTNLRSQVLRGDSFRLQLLAGFRYLELIEGLDVAAVNTFTGNVPVFGGGSVRSFDSFATGNYFYGGQVGTVAEFGMGGFSATLLGKVALGTSHEVTTIRGGTTLISPVGTTTSVGSGFLALPSNRGRYSSDRFAVVPEVGINLNYQVTNYLGLSLGYTFLYWSSVNRPGNQVDTSLNLTQVPPPVGPPALVGPARPLFPNRDSDYWAQGLNFGVQLRY